MYFAPSPIGEDEKKHGLEMDRANWNQWLKWFLFNQESNDITATDGKRPWKSEQQPE